MAIAFVKSTAVATAIGFTSVTVGMTTTAGNLLVAHSASYAQTVTVTDSKGNTWTNVASYTATSGRVRMDYAQNCLGGASHTFTATVGTSDYPTITVQEISGAALTGALDQSNTDFVSGASTSHATGNITTTDAGDILVGVASSPSGTTFAASAPFTQDRELDTGSNEGILTGYYIPGATGTYNFAYTTGTSTSARSIVAAFKPAAGGGGGGSAALTGVSATGSVGSVGNTHTLALTGNGATGSAGSVTPSESLALTGNGATGSAGNVTPSTTIGITGNGATGSVGNVSATSPGTASLTGVLATGAVGTLAPSSTLALTGNGSTGSAGSVTPSRSLALTGNGATGSAGNVTPSTTIGITGNGATGSPGNVTAGAGAGATLTGVSATGAVGSIVRADHTVALTGAAAIGTAGSMSVPGTFDLKIVRFSNEEMRQPINFGSERLV